jgi:hypothetical protein
MCQAKRMKVCDAVADLTEDAEYFWTQHASGHDDTEEVVGSVLHDLIVMTMIADDIDCFDDIDVL